MPVGARTRLETGRARFGTDGPEGGMSDTFRRRMEIALGGKSEEHAGSKSGDGERYSTSEHDFSPRDENGRPLRRGAYGH